jgi:flavin reductase (DIM6/NTAB) family NADH-FMN oxidoreductase RutF
MAALAPYLYRWPRADLRASAGWNSIEGGQALVRELPENREDLAADSRWPAFFPSPICFVTTTDGLRVGLEKVVGPAIVNRFPYVLALSFCRETLSERHHPRSTFMRLLEKSGTAAVQFLPPGPVTDAAMQAVTSVSEAQTSARIAHSHLATREAFTNASPVFDDAYMVYEARLVSPGKDFDGRDIHTEPWLDVGSHRLYFLEINAIQLRQDIAEGRSQVRWHSLPGWSCPAGTPHPPLNSRPAEVISGRYLKRFTPNYVFPSPGTVAFEADAFENGMAIKVLPPNPRDQVEVNNDRARWPCFFPSSLGMITTWADVGIPNVMPCGSTLVLSRHPLMVAPCVSYMNINERYGPRASLKAIRRTGRFGCGVPWDRQDIVDAIAYTGNFSITDDSHKIANAGLQVRPAKAAPVLSTLPIHFECEVTGEIPLGTHAMFLGEVRRIRVRADVTPENAIEWCPWAKVAALDVPEPGAVPTGC